MTDRSEDRPSENRVRMTVTLSQKSVEIVRACIGDDEGAERDDFLDCAIRDFEHTLYSIAAV